MAIPRIAAYDLPKAEDLPIPRAPWRFDPSRAALLVHDMQGYFCAAYDRDAAPLAPVIANIARLAAACRVAGIPVFYTAQHGDQDRRDRGLQADLWGPGMSETPEHVDILPELAPQAGDIRLLKHRYSAFQRSNLDSLMRVRNRDQLIITGIYAHIGCLATAAEAFQRDIEPFFVADALADFSRDRHDMAVDWIAACCGVPVMTEALVSQF
ncbi:isochorismatase family protein [Puniceibacterium sp. IMCC21224]|uniref:isochorismatase family protein n=1 Tax=Puniceibacterium sp. IMCC21224 TaxID=1618204 RepID=UPI00064DCD73|nr:isochorismatase family protein [Puniceibacterium sp. IMCC21224]KMK66993.1 isochorismate hydrolase [Puniceibacterium sp. IMCC21224]